MPACKAFKPNAGEKEFLLALFRTLDERGQVPGPEIAAYTGGRKVVSMADLRQTHAASAIQADEDERRARNRVRQAFKRAGDWLRNARVIGVQDDFVWWTGRTVHGVPQTYPKALPSRASTAETFGGDDGLPF